MAYFYVLHCLKMFFIVKIKSMIFSKTKQPSANIALQNFTNLLLPLIEGHTVTQQLRIQRVQIYLRNFLKMRRVQFFALRQLNKTYYTSEKKAWYTFIEFEGGSCTLNSLISVIFLELYVCLSIVSLFDFDLDKEWFVSIMKNLGLSVCCRILLRTTPSCKSTRS